jgi:dCMP deaminase
MLLDWDTYFINIAKEVAKRSKDPSTKTGAVIIDEKHRPVSFGYNGFISGCNEDCMTWDRPMKYHLVLHAEMNAILFAKRDLAGCSIYCTLAPCENCLKHLIQTGIRRIIYDAPIANSNTQGNGGLPEETMEAVTRVIQSVGDLEYRNLNGDSYLEEIWGKGKVPNYKDQK